MAVGGGSADRRAADLAADGDASAGAWAAGAEGERRVAEALSHLPEAWTVLHDRLLSPGLSPVNLDHVVVGPAGAFLIDAKNWRGSITAWQDNLYQHTGSRDARQSQSRQHEVAKVHGMAAYMAADTAMPVTPVICLAGRHEGEFGEPQLIRGVWVLAVSQVTAWLRSQPSRLEREEVERAAVTLMTSFPSTTTDSQLLAAMGAAAQATKSPRRRRHPRRVPVPVSRPAPRRGGGFARLFKSLVALALTLGAVAIAVNVVPTFVLGRMLDETPSTGTTGATPPGVPGASPAATPKASPKPTTARKPTTADVAPTPVVAPVSTCAGLTAAQVGAIVGRKVQPVATRQGCMWGTRLDEPSTAVVSLLTQSEYRPHEYQYVSSAGQRRVVYGSAYDNDYDPATSLWVAAGQPIIGKQKTVIARTNTQVIVSTEDLDTTDERARWMARAIAMAVNASP